MLSSTDLKLIDNAFEIVQELYNDDLPFSALSFDQLDELFHAVSIVKGAIEDGERKQTA